MRYWAQLDSDNIVIQVIVADSVEWCEAEFGGTWVETFRKGVERKNFAGTGFTYDSDLDAFIPPQKYESWVLDEATCLWEAPITMPNDGASYEWDEESTSWTLVE